MAVLAPVGVPGRLDKPDRHVPGMTMGQGRLDKPGKQPAPGMAWVPGKAGVPDRPAIRLPGKAPDTRAQQGMPGMLAWPGREVAALDIGGLQDTGWVPGRRASVRH